MGVVYRARDPKIDRLVAIKTISLAGQEPEEEQAYRERFVQEARAAGRLSHPGIVAIFDAGEDPETHEPYLVMEYVAGEPLSRILAGGDHKLPLSDALQFAYEVAEALDYAHSQGVIHRDIKPANILITEDGRAKIADFGVARLNHALVTHKGQIFGSPAYMAPEQLSGGVADARSDLFSLGVMLYSMITGFRPFQGNSAETVCFKVMNIEPVPVTSFQHDVPAELDAIMARAIAKDPAERFQSGAEMAQQIRNFVGSGVADATSFFARVIRKDAATASAKWASIANAAVLGLVDGCGCSRRTVYRVATDGRYTHRRRDPAAFNSCALCTGCEKESGGCQDRVQGLGQAQKCQPAGCSSRDGKTPSRDSAPLQYR